MLKRLRYLKPSYGVRERYHYGQLTYFVAGLAMEKINNKTWEDLCKDNILGPLKMSHTNFSIEETKKQSNIAFPYMEKQSNLKKVPLRNISLIGPAGSMNSNIDDMTHWLELQLSNGEYQGKRLISESTLQELRSPQVVMPSTPEAR